MTNTISFTSKNYETDLTLYTVDDPNYIMLFIPGGVRQTQVSFHLVPWCLKKKVSVAVFELTKNFNKTGMPAKFRSSNERQGMLDGAINYLNTLYPTVPIGCLGHSFGAIEASYLSMHPVPKVKKIVISNAAWVPSKDPNILYKDGYVQHFDAAAVVTPTLIMHHINDETEQCPYTAAQVHMERLPNITVRNGFPHLGSPGTMPGPHFYTGQEAEVFDNIHQWFKDENYNSQIG